MGLPRVMPSVHGDIALEPGSSQTPKVTAFPAAKACPRGASKMNSLTLMLEKALVRWKF